ncbi:MAG: hypothetical protein FH753_15605 [Firmicutes bacterium]|nr:hypothetical protein [Bacillota bacterium]
MDLNIAQVESLYIKETKVTKDKVNLYVINCSSAGVFSGYTTKVKNNELYIGLKYKLFTLNISGGSDIQIPLKQKNLQKIYLKGPNSTVEIWDRDIG